MAQKELKDDVDKAIRDMLKATLEPADRIKLLAVAVRWEATKNKLVLQEHGMGFEEIDEGL